MFMFPEPSPTDYRLRFASLCNLSSEQHTPFGFPRVTQPGIGIYSYPIRKAQAEYRVNKVPGRILDRWTQEFKPWWVEKPGVDAEYMHRMYTQFRGEKKELDPRYVFKPSIFPRSYQYELDCLEYRRLQKLGAKMYREEYIKDKPIEDKDESCKCLEDDDVMKKQDEVLENSLPRWTKPPKLFAKSQTDPCKRRQQFQKCGQPFKSEACKFYYEHYPSTSKFKIINKKFS